MLKKKEKGKLKGLRDFLREEEGMVFIFKTQLRSLVEKVFEKITKDSNTVMS